MNDKYAAVVAQVHDDMYRLDDADILAHPIVQRLISDRTTAAEPDAATVERVAKGLFDHENESLGAIASWDELLENYGRNGVAGKAVYRDLARAAIAAMPSCTTEPCFPAPDFEWDVDAVIEAREDAGEPGDPETAQRVVDIAHDVLLTFKYTLQTYPFSNLNTVVWLVSEMVRLAEEKAAMPSGKDAEWLDEALDSVGADDIIVQRARHPRNDIDWEHPGYTFCCDLWSHANYDDPNPDPISGGNGTTRREAILDAVQKAKEASGE